LGLGGFGGYIQIYLNFVKSLSTITGFYHMYDCKFK